MSVRVLVGSVGVIDPADPPNEPERPDGETRISDVSPSGRSGSSVTFVTGATLLRVPEPRQAAADPQAASGSAADHPAPASGAQVGRYVLQRKLGEGGMGVVFVAHDPELQREVALKILRTGVFGTDSTQAQQRMLREAQAMAMVNHPNLVPIYDVGTYDKTIFLAMEYVRGQTLEAWLGDEPPLEDIVEVFEQAGMALQAVHDAGLVHRDFKPANVMVTAARVAKVLDLGIARKLAVRDAADGLHETQTALVAQAPEADSGVDAFAEKLTQQGALVGTPAYMAPEQLRGDAIVPATDQFAFSVSLYEALTGRGPFAGRGAIGIMANILAGEIRPWPQRCEAPEGLRRAVERGLAAQPAERFGSMRELLQACRLGMGVRGQIRALTGSWLTRNKDPEYLLAQGSLLEEAGQLLFEQPPAFNAEQAEFVRASLAAERRRQIRRRVVLGGLMTVTLGLIPTVGLLQRRSAQLEASRSAELAARMDAVRRRVLPVLDEAREQLLMMFAQRFAWWPQLDRLMHLSAVESGPQRDAAFLSAVTQLNHYFRPIVERTRIVSSLHVANDAGMELLVFDDPDADRLDPPYRFYNRLVRRDLFGDSAFEVFWPSDGPAAPRTRWLQLGDPDSRGRTWKGYRPTQRKWFADAVAQQDGAVSWTTPYLFFTTKDPGMTGSTVFTRGDHRYVIAVDFMLNDLSRITTEIGSSSYLVCIVTRSGHCVGLPADPRFDTPEKVRAFFVGRNRDKAGTVDASASLPTVSSLGIPLLDAALRPHVDQAETYHIAFEGDEVLVARTPVGDPQLGLSIYVVETPAGSTG